MRHARKNLRRKTVELTAVAASLTARSGPVLAALCGALLAGGNATRAASPNRYWDINGATAGAGGATPSGTWSGSSAVWNQDISGAVAPESWEAGKVAVFSAGADATGSFGVTVTGTHVVGGMIVEEGGPQLGGSGSIDLGSSLVTFNVLPVFDTGLPTSIDVPVTGTGSGGIIKAGFGKLRLGAADYDGNTFVDAGELELNGTSAILSNSNIDIAAGGTLRLNNGVSVHGVTGGPSTLLSGAGTLIAGPLADLTLNGDNHLSFTGAMDVFGTLRFGNPNAAGSSGTPITLNGGTLLFDHTDVSGTCFSFRSVNQTIESFIGVTAGNQVNFAGTINGGSQRVNIVGGGKLFVIGTVSGASAIRVLSNGGTLGATHAAAWGGTAGVPGSGPSVTVSGPARLETFGGPVMPNPLVLNGGDSGVIMLSAQTPGGGFSGPVTLQNSAFVGVGGDNDFTMSGNISGDGGLAKLGPSTLTLTGANTHASGTIINAGTLAVTSDANLGATSGELTFDGGALRFDAAFALSSSRPITLGAGGGTIHTNGFDIALLQPLGGSGALTKAGAGNLTLLAPFSHGAAVTTITGGRLTPNASFASASLNITGGELAAVGQTITVTSASTNGVAGKINLIGVTLNLGTGASKLANSGRINLIDCTVNGDIDSITGGVISAAGDVTFNGNITGGGSFAESAGGKTVLAPSTLRVIQAQSVSVAGSGRIDLTDNKLIVTGGDVGSWNGSEYTGITGLIRNGRNPETAAWDGSGIVTSMSDATTNILTTLAVAKAGEVGFDTVGGVSVSPEDVVVKYTWGGDADMNGELNGDDYFWIDSNILQIQSGATELLSFHNGDFNYDGALNGDDYFILDSNILQAQASSPFPTGSGIGGLASVPEPASMALTATLSITLLCRRRRARSNARL